MPLQHTLHHNMLRILPTLLIAFHWLRFRFKVLTKSLTEFVFSIFVFCWPKWSTLCHFSWHIMMDGQIMKKLVWCRKLSEETIVVGEHNLTIHEYIFSSKLILTPRLI